MMLSEHAIPSHPCILSMAMRGPQGTCKATLIKHSHMSPESLDAPLFYNADPLEH